MDSPEASVGNTVYFPVNVPGAMLFLGDGHAAMGDGEIAGTALEVPLRGRVQVHVIKGQKISWPRFENDDYIMTVGAYRPLDDALRIAFTELVGWIHTDYGLSEMDAYELLSKVGEIHLNEMVDPNYVIVAKVKKSFLPKPKHDHRQEAGSSLKSPNGVRDRYCRDRTTGSEGLTTWNDRSSSRCALDFKNPTTSAGNPQFPGWSSSPRGQTCGEPCRCDR